MQRLHELIDREDPSCLYCKATCDLKQDGFFIAGTLSLYYEVQILTCRKCHEIFEIHWIDDNGETKFLCFVFTCKEIAVTDKYDEGFHIGSKGILYDNWKGGISTYLGTEIPAFPVDFSNKRKLYNKLKTYLVFS